MISWIIKTEVCVIWGLCYHDIMRKPNSIIFLLYIYTYNSSSETEAKRSAILFLRRTLQGA